MIIEGIECPDKSSSMSIWIDAHVPNRSPILTINIKGDYRAASLNGQLVELEPVINISVPFEARNWQSLVGLKVDDATLGSHFNAWRLHQHDSEVERFSLALLACSDNAFTVECSAELIIYDQTDKPHTAQLYTLSSIPFHGIGVGIRGDSNNPVQVAITLLSRFMDSSNLMIPVTHERKLSKEDAVVAYEVHFAPAIEIQMVNNEYIPTAS
jgi:hypothetical protein